jgi:pimeloyl-ACP methyl ester carboxylesterase
MKLSNLKKAFCSHNKGGLIAVMIAIFVCIISQQSKADEFAGIEVTTKGSGSAIIFIPGLNSAEDTFTDACTAMTSKHKCYLLHLPGFAGQKPMDLQQGFLVPVKNNIIALMKKEKLSKVTLVGHSLGGLISLMITLDAPELIDKIVIVESLPFFPAIQNPSLTVEMAKPQAEQMRAQMNAPSDADYIKNAAFSVQGMSNQASRQPLLVQWSQTSDRATTTQAMYELMVTDLRASIAAINKPVMVLGAWAAYKPYGSTKESTKAIFATQYAQLKNVDIRMSETGFHFLTWDDSEWVNQQITQFLNQ